MQNTASPPFPIEKTCTILGSKYSSPSGVATISANTKYSSATIPLLKDHLPSLAPSTPLVLPPSPPPPLAQVHVTIKVADCSSGKGTSCSSCFSFTDIASKFTRYPPITSNHSVTEFSRNFTGRPSKPGALAPTPSANQENSSNSSAPVIEPIAPAPVATPSRNSPRKTIHQFTPKGPTALPPRAPIPDPLVPVASPPRKVEMTPPPVRPMVPPSISPIKSPPGESPRSSPTVHQNVPVGNPSPLPGSSPAISPPAPIARRKHSNSIVPSLAPSNEGHNSSAFSPSNERHNSSAFSPSTSFRKHQHKGNETNQVQSALRLEEYKGHYAPPPLNSEPHISPKVSPSVLSIEEVPKVAPPPPSLPRVMSFPPPPPNEDCSTTICTDPYTNTPPGSPCGCVLPMQVGLRLSVALYTFFPLVSELAGEIAAGVFMKPSQVRIMGANAASEQPEKTLVLIDLVPLGEKFDNTTAFITYNRFWHKQVAIKSSLFGDYEVLYVRYLGLPPSPPLPPDAGMIDGGPYPGNDNNARAIKPLGVDVHGKQQKNVLSGGVIAIIVLSGLVVVVLCSAFAWVLLFKRRDEASQRATTPQHPLTPHAKPSGSAGSMVGSGLSSISLSFGSSIAPYTGSAKTFTASEIERATDNFDDSRILGEGGFGRVYSGVLDDGTKVAVKVLKRDDQQGGREFLAEVEMLSRLHHRNLVKLIGICTEERNRCLVYELIPNGSVESHLHGVDKESAPLDWDARIKIALGAARGLAYLHEDSSPRVIHRDFKSSNILLEHDFTPKILVIVSVDLAGYMCEACTSNKYVAPEYAMTGHLLVKSDVYSYGVVLLELLTGRKPIDMTQPPGRENLVAWARPLLATREGLETIINPSLGSDVPFESVAKVAAIASMCVQPEVSHRPFMGEVVQALKLVCNECDEAKEVGGSRGSSQDDFSINMDGKVGTGSGRLSEPLQSHYSIPNYDVSGLDTERGLSVSDIFSSSTRFGRQPSESFRRQCSSGPLRTGRGSRFWQNMQRLSRGSISEHGAMMRFWTGSH
ncbi:hypothetical protein V6N13_107315 [Hibiscus sabdariffa]